MTKKLTETYRSLMSRFPILRNTYVRFALLGIAIALPALLAGFGYAYAISPAAIRSPQFEHLHFRMQVVVDGKQVNFADKKYQEGYGKDNCNAQLTLHPVHFHDKKDQLVHVHWKNLSGGQVLKYYGWNRIGGVDGMLGTRFDSFPDLKTVPIHGRSLPAAPKGANYYVYVGDEKGYKTKPLTDFLHQDLETFFQKRSKVKADEAASVLDRLFPTAAAHNGVVHEPGAAHDDQAELARINNLLGNVVIFVQKSKPSDAAIKARFADLEPLSESSCAG